MSNTIIYNDIHTDITDKLSNFICESKIPNIIFHGPSGGGKRTIVHKFINVIYENDKTIIKNNVMYVSCAHGKGIKFVRDELKLFSKTHINFKNKNLFKTVILSNADQLTIDAQSALRRCIELFSHSTRFFIIVEDKYKLLRPILSRFCEIYIPHPEINNMKVNLHKYNRQINNKYKLERDKWLDKYLKTLKLNNYLELVNTSEKLYNKAYSGLDVINYFETSECDMKRKYQLLLAFNKVKSEINNEKLLIFFILNYIYLGSNVNLENMSFM